MGTTAEDIGQKTTESLNLEFVAALAQLGPPSSKSDPVSLALDEIVGCHGRLNLLHPAGTYRDALLS